MKQATKMVPYAAPSGSWAGVAGVTAIIDILYVERREPQTKLAFGF